VFSAVNPWKRNDVKSLTEYNLAHSLLPVVASVSANGSERPELANLILQIYLLPRAVPPHAVTHSVPATMDSSDRNITEPQHDIDPATRADRTDSPKNRKHTISSAQPQRSRFLLLPPETASPNLRARLLTLIP
jgi:hypothetical protein